MKINVYFRGKRTSARFPEYLWNMACIAEGFDSCELADQVQVYLDTADYPAMWTASEAVRHYLCLLVELALMTSSPRSGAVVPAGPGL